MFDSFELLKLISQMDPRLVLSGSEHSWTETSESEAKARSVMSPVQAAEEQGSTSGLGSKQLKLTEPPLGTLIVRLTVALAQ